MKRSRVFKCLLCTERNLYIFCLGLFNGWSGEGGGV